MATATELAISEELGHLQNIVEKRADSWKLEIRSPTEFVLGLLAKDGSWIWFLVKCDQYPAFPPVWHWYNPSTGAIDQPPDIPKPGGFFYASGVICAPWNRLAYAREDARGPHSDWTIGSWKMNPQTGSCRTLAAMALRLHVELQGPHFTGRKG